MSDTVIGGCLRMRQDGAIKEPVLETMTGQGREFL